MNNEPSSPRARCVRVPSKASGGRRLAPLNWKPKREKQENPPCVTAAACALTAHINKAAGVPQGRGTGPSHLPHNLHQRFIPTTYNNNSKKKKKFHPIATRTTKNLFKIRLSAFRSRFEDEHGHLPSSSSQRTGLCPMNSSWRFAPTKERPPSDVSDDNVWRCLLGVPPPIIKRGCERASLYGD